MGVVPENTCVSQEAEPEAVGEGPTPAQRPAGDPLTYDELLREYNQLRERSVRTTNALASAAHDLKTPLAILNGYIELLQNEKLGSLNERQREILGDMHASGQRLQHFIQDFLSYTRARNRRDEDAVRDRQRQSLPVRSLPAVVAPLSGKGPGALLPGQRKTARVGV